MWAQPLVAPKGTAITPQDQVPDLPRTSAYYLEPGRPAPGWATLLRPPIGNNATLLGPEY